MINSDRDRLIKSAKTVCLTASLAHTHLEKAELFNIINAINELRFVLVDLGYGGLDKLRVDPKMKVVRPID